MVAVERATSHALVVVLKSEHARVKLGVHHPMMPPHADKQREDECYCQPAQYRGEVKDVFQHGSPPRLQQDCAEQPLQPPVKFTQHGSPHGLHQPRNNAAVSSKEQAGVDGYAVKQHLRLRVVWQGLL